MKRNIEMTYRNCTASERIGGESNTEERVGKSCSWMIHIVITFLNF